MDTSERNKILEIIFMTVISTLLVLTGIYYLPFIIFLYPIPLIIIGVKHGIKYNTISSLISILTIGLVIDPISGISVLVLFLPITLGLSYMITKGRKPLEILGINTIILLICFLITIGVTGDMTGVSILSELEDSFSQILNTQVELLQDMDYSSYELSQIKDMLENALDYILLIFPAMVIMFSFIITSINYIISSIILKKWGNNIDTIPKFSKFKLPDNVLIGIAIMLISTLLLKKLDFFYYDTVVLNITVFASFMFVVQGLSVIDYKLIKMNMKMFLRILIIAFFIVLLPLGWLISFLGVLDIIFDFRKIGKKAKS